METSERYLWIRNLERNCNNPRSWWPHSPPAHDPHVEEYSIVLNGTVNLEVQRELIEGVTPGMIVYFPPNVEHRPINSNDEPAVQLGFKSLEGTIHAIYSNITITNIDE